VNNSNAHLSEEVLLELQKIMEDDFVILLETYLSDSALKLQAIDDAITAENVANLRDSVHGLKGSSSNIGALKLTQHCADMEDLARNDKYNDAVALVSSIKDEFARVKQLLEQKLREIT